MTAVSIKGDMSMGFGLHRENDGEAPMSFIAAAGIARRFTALAACSFHASALAAMRHPAARAGEARSGSGLRSLPPGLRKVGRGAPVAGPAAGDDLAISLGAHRIPSATPAPRPWLSSTASPRAGGARGDRQDRPYLPIRSRN